MKKYFNVFKGVKLPWLLILLCTITSIAMMSSELAVATLTADIIDTSQKAINAKPLMSYIIMAIVVAVLTILNNYFTRRMEETITLRVRTKLWSKIMRLPTKYYDADSGDGLISRVTSDCTAPAQIFTVLVSFIVCTVTTVQAFLQLYDYNASLANYSLIIIPLTLALSALFAVLQFKLGVYGTVTMSGSLGYLSERVRSFRLIKSACAEELESKKGSYTFKRMYIADFLSWLLVAGYQLASSIFSILFIVIVFVIGSRLLKTGAVTIGDLTGFYMITGIVSVQLMQFFMNAGGLFGVFGTMKKISSVMDTQSERYEGTPVPELCADLGIDKVSFAYSEERDVLHGLTINLPMGKRTAIIGGNGAGKSTIFKLILRLYEPKSGKLCFNGTDISEFDLVSWRDRFSYVSQTEPLIGGTVRDNITYGLDREVSEEELIAVAKKANCYDFVMEKPDGFDEDVGLGGSNFSGGQAQCISIARAMLKNADFLLLDEATSNLDVLSEALVTDAMDKLMQDKTTIMIAHSYAATKNADYVIVMREGVAEAAGTPAELLKTNEYYQIFSRT